MPETTKSVAVICDCLPSSQSTAGVLLRKVLEQFPENWTVKIFVVRSEYLPLELVKPLPHVEVELIPEPQSEWSSPLLRSARPLLEKLAESETRRLSAQVCKSISGMSPDYLISMPQTHTVASISANSHKNIGAKFKVAIMTDHYSWWSRSRNLSPKSDRKFSFDWGAVFEDSNIIILPSERARKLFPGKYEKTHVLYPWVSANDQESSKRRKDPTDSVIRIGFAGQPYAKAELNDLANQLTQKNWRVHGRVVEFHHFGKKRLQINSSSYVFRGFVGDTQLVNELRELDYAFLPYPGNLEMAQVAETSFPSKLASYLASGLPIIYHGPKESSVWDFLSEQKLLFPLEEFTSENVDFLNKDWGTLVRSTYESNFSEKAFEAKILSIFRIDSTLPIKKYGKIEHAHLKTTIHSKNRLISWGELNQKLTLSQISLLSPKVGRLLSPLSLGKDAVTWLSGVANKTFYLTFKLIYSLAIEAVKLMSRLRKSYFRSK